MRSWQPILVLLPRESHGQRRLASCSSQYHTALDTEVTKKQQQQQQQKRLAGLCPWGRKEYDMTEAAEYAVITNDCNIFEGAVKTNFF